MSTFIIGIAGGSGSGKSTLSNNLASFFDENDVTVLRHDNYYKPHPDLTLEERQKLNFDSPDAMDTALLIEHLKRLKNGESISCPVYDFTEHTRTEETLTINPTPVIIVDGILIFENEELRNLFDLKIFVDVDADERILRRLIRDCKKRGRTPEEVRRQYLDTVKPMHDKYVEPSKDFADFIVPTGGKNPAVLEVLKCFVEGKLRFN